jgi:hypothetical protein
MRLGRLCGVAFLLKASSAGAQEQPTPGDCAGLAANSAEAAILHCHGEVTDPAVAALLSQDPLNEAPFPAQVPFSGTGREAFGFMDPVDAPSVPGIIEQAPALAQPTARSGPLVQIDGEEWATEQQRARSAVDAAAAPAAREGFWQAPSRLVPLTPIAEPHVQIDGQTVSMDQWHERRAPDMLAAPVQVEIPDEDLAATLPPAIGTMRSAVIDGVTVDLDPVSYELLELILRSAGGAETEDVPLVGAENLGELGEQE